MMAGGMSRGAAIGNEKQLWPNVNGKRVIPYVINSGMMHVRWRFISVYIHRSGVANSIISRAHINSYTHVL